MTRRPSFDVRQHGRKILIVLLVLLGLNVAAAVLVVQPKVREHRRLEEANRPRIEALKALQAEVEAYEGYLAALDKAESDLATLREDVLATRPIRLVDVQDEVNRLAKQFNVTGDKVQYKNDVLEEEGLEYVGMVFPLEGGEDNLRRFISAVEASEEFLVIEQVALDRARDGGALLQLSITLATYFDAPEELKQPAARPRRRSRRGT